MSVEDELISKWGKDELEARLSAKLKEYHQLIPRESALMILNLEAIGSTVRPETLNMGSKSLRPVQLRVRLERVFPQRVSERDGGISKSQRVSVSDHSGAGTIVFYDSACQFLEHSALIGDLVQVGPVRFRGGEFHLLPGAIAECTQKGGRLKIVDSTHQASSSVGHFEGAITDFFGDFPYRKGQSRLAGDAPSALMSSFELTDASGKARVVLWDSPGMAGKLKSGLSVEIENGQRRGGEIHISSSGRLLIHQVQETVRPKVGKIEFDAVNPSRIIVSSSDGRTFLFPSLDEAAARLAAGPIPDGVDGRTMLELKKKDWIGKDLPASWEKYLTNQ